MWHLGAHPEQIFPHSNVSGHVCCTRWWFAPWGKCAICDIALYEEKLTCLDMLGNNYSIVRQPNSAAPSITNRVTFLLCTHCRAKFWVFKLQPRVQFWQFNAWMSVLLWHWRQGSFREKVKSCQRSKSRFFFLQQLVVGNCWRILEAHQNGKINRLLAMQSDEF